MIEQRSSEIRNKNVSLDDTEKEIARVKDLNTSQNVEIVALRRDVDRVSSDCYDIRKNIESLECRNTEVGSQIRNREVMIKEKEADHYGVRKDIEN